MGIAFVLIFHLIVIGMLSGLIAIIGSLGCYFFSRIESRKRNILTMIIAPFVALYIMYIVGLVGSGIVSEYKNIDIGIGDAWYVPLSNECQLWFIDVTEAGYIYRDNETVLSEVTHLQQVDHKLFGKTAKDTYFSYDVVLNTLTEYATDEELISQNTDVKFNLIKAIEFYGDKRNEIAGIELTIVGIVALLSGVLGVILTRIVIVKIFQLRMKL